MGKDAVLKIAIGVIATMLLFYFYLTADRTPTYNWTPTYNIDSKEPYGCYLFHSLVKEGAGNDQYRQLDGPLSNTLNDFEGSNGTYVFIGSSTYYSEEDYYALADFVDQGNTAYIFTEGAPYDVLNYLEIYSTIFFGTFYDKNASLNIIEGNDEVTLGYIDNWREESYNWAYADSIYDDQIGLMGNIDNDKINYIRLQYGSGELFLHLTPLVFTNFHLKDEDKLDYANTVLSNFNDGPIFWDNFSQIPSEGDGLSQSPLSFILSQESLRWAWYVLLASALVYLIMYTRRKQRVIPVINKTKNTSIEFVKTIGSMYYHQQDHLNIIQHQRQLFLTFINTKYGITYQDQRESFLKKVSLKSGQSKADIDMILMEAKRLERLEKITTKDLVGYNQLTENFYRNCK